MPPGPPEAARECLTRQVAVNLYQGRHSRDWAHNPSGLDLQCLGLLWPHSSRTEVTSAQAALLVLRSAWRKSCPRHHASRQVSRSILRLRD
ncbi:hypothetical protein WJX84_001864 [Apatococcus fuscideae]|uniref:Uncharacterized protein n=1 Tax=Apatococcus fuscideae TaxID=2026836 RepID=A0AAW1SMP3_9CHLO